MELSRNFPDTVRVDKNVFLTMHRILQGELTLDSPEAADAAAFCTKKLKKLEQNVYYRQTHVRRKSVPQAHTEELCGGE
jgi:hypothetical protein